MLRQSETPPAKGGARPVVGQDPGTRVGQSARRIFECDYIYENADAMEWFRRRRYRLEPIINGRNKSIVYGWQSGNRWYPQKREGADALLYHLPDLLDARSRADVIVWTEGEKDADAVNEHASLVATSHHGGAGSANKDQAAWFRGHHGLVLLAYDLDADDPKSGGNPGAYCVTRRYQLLLDAGIDRRQVGIIHAATGKDLSDHFAAGHTFDDVVPLRSDRDLADLLLKAKRTRRRSTMRRYGYGLSS